MKTEKQQSAVEFAVGQLEKFIPKGNQIAIYAILEQAKEMEKEQIIQFATDCIYKDDCFFIVEQYYNETFKPE